MTSQLKTLFVVYDSTRQDQPALVRAADIAEAVSARLHLFTCTFSDSASDGEQSAQARRMLAEQRELLAQVVAPLRARGIEVDTEVEWDKNWYRAAVRASIGCSADMVLKSSFRHCASQRLLNKTSDWTLMRECLCPVMLVKESTVPHTPRVLAAVDICARTESYGRLNQNVINFSKKVSARQGVEVHFINAFQNYKGVPSRKQLIRNCGTRSDRIHIKLGKPETVIVEQAKKLDASLVVMGNSARSGLPAAFMGNTVEKVLDKLECDVLSMPQGEELLRNA